MFERKDRTYDGDSMRTPPYLVEWLDSIYHFDIDLAASDDNNLQFGHYFTKDCDALSKKWYYKDSKVERKMGFVNPPYSRHKKRSWIDRFVDKAIEETENDFTTVMAIPELNGEARTKKILSHAVNIIHFDKRIMFIHPVTGKALTSNSRGTMIVEFSKKRFQAKPNHIYASIEKRDVNVIVCDELIR